MRIRRKPWARAELDACPFFVKEPSENKGNWKEKFAKKQPMNLELGCGKGSFVAQIATMNTDKNYVAVDIKSEMLGLAKRKTEAMFEEKNLPTDNVFLTAYDVERIGDVFDTSDEIERIYINFCNPWSKLKHQKHRLTHTKQLETYKKFLKPGAEIEFKTDDDGLFLSSQRYFDEAGFDIIFITHDLHSENISSIMTEHEKMFSDEGIKIKYLVAKLR